MPAKFLALYDGPIETWPESGALPWQHAHAQSSPAGVLFVSISYMQYVFYVFIYVFTICIYHDRYISSEEINCKSSGEDTLEEAHSDSVKLRKSV